MDAGLHGKSFSIKFKENFIHVKNTLLIIRVQVFRMNIDLFILLTMMKKEKLKFSKVLKQTNTLITFSSIVLLCIILLQLS